MTTPYRKKLIEVALPLAKINEAAAREKSIRHGHPSTLHLWWARRPLAACRAVLFASLVDDPDSDPEFSFDENVAASKRAKLFNLIEELVLWENSTNPRVINAARAEIARCVASRKLELKELKADDKIGGATVFDIKGMLAKPEDVNAFLAEHAPPVLDPFCGGGSIPLEAQRLGLRAYASDLNPVPVLITKALIEIPPKFAGRPPVNPDRQKKSKQEKAATVWHGAQGLAADVLVPAVRLLRGFIDRCPDELAVLASGRAVAADPPLGRRLRPIAEGADRLFAGSDQYPLARAAEHVPARSRGAPAKSGLTTPHSVCCGIRQSVDPAPASRQQLCVSGWVPTRTGSIKWIAVSGAGGQIVATPMASK